MCLYTLKKQRLKKYSKFLKAVMGFDPRLEKLHVVRTSVVEDMRI